jgi:hypothetical protein
MVQPTIVWRWSFEYGSDRYWPPDKKTAEAAGKRLRPVISEVADPDPAVTVDPLVVEGDLGADTVRSQPTWVCRSWAAGALAASPGWTRAWTPSWPTTSSLREAGCAGCVRRAALRVGGRLVICGVGWVRPW